MAQHKPTFQNGHTKSINYKVNRTTSQTITRINDPTTMSFSIFWGTNFKKFQTFSFVKCSHNQPSVVQFMSNHLANIYLSFEHQFLDPRSTISTHLGESLRAFGFEFRIRGKSIAHSTLTSWDTKKTIYSVHFLTFFWLEIYHNLYQWFVSCLLISLSLKHPE